MDLPILQTTTAEPTRDDLVRFFYRTQLHWSRHLAEETALDVGTALANPDLAGVPDANRVMDLAAPQGTTAEQVVDEVLAHFAAKGVRCELWSLAPGAPSETTRPLVEHLAGRGFTSSSFDILHINRQPTGAVREVG